MHLVSSRCMQVLSTARSPHSQVRSFREDRMILAAQNYIANTLGQRFIDSRPLNLKVRHPR